MDATNIPHGLAIVLSAPSGTGKTTVCNAWRKRNPGIRFSVSHTTRAPRAGEQDGDEYFFVSEEQFKRMIDAGEFLEWARVHEHYYGTARATIEPILAKGEDVILDLDVQGAASLRKLKFPAVYILLLPPSLKELERRLKQRNTETEASLRTRLEVSRKEIAQFKLYDYMVTNDEVEETVETLAAILRAEKHRVERFRAASPEIQEILKGN